MSLVKIRYFCIVLAIGALLIGPVSTHADNVSDLQQTIKDHQAKIETLKRQAAAYQASLEAKRKLQLTLANQITILTDRVEKTKVDIQTTETQIQTTTLQIQVLQETIHARELQLTQYRYQLGSLVRWLARSRDESPLRVVFTSASFADFTNQLKYLKTVQLSVTDLIGQVETTKAQLIKDKQDQEAKRKELVADVDALNTLRQSLEGQQETKSYLLDETRSSERRFAQLLEDAKREQQLTEEQMSSLEQQVRDRLRARGISTRATIPGFIWPVPNSRGISATFHDLDYPFRRVFEHTGIDIRQPQGSPIRAAASGYVAQARTGGARGYGFVMIVHDGGVATVYGHVSKIFVTQDSFVAQGQVIANSGGLPGTQGAGPFSTGAHLHFEVRKDGIPVNPMQYLP